MTILASRWLVISIHDLLCYGILPSAFGSVGVHSYKCHVFKFLRYPFTRHQLPNIDVGIVLSARAGVASTASTAAVVRSLAMFVFLGRGPRCVACHEL
jgi:hypothetical protein